mmetsp:Transcript_17332/g.53790  ORF Transcript_17332/g.53790 Transcript_17332/m.53790 type:complete len:218 (+) Transcript_17332:4881-5534(+)
MDCWCESVGGASDGADGGASDTSDMAAAGAGAEGTRLEAAACSEAAGAGTGAATAARAWTRPSWTDAKRRSRAPAPEGRLRRSERSESSMRVASRARPSSVRAWARAARRSRSPGSSCRPLSKASSAARNSPTFIAPKPVSRCSAARSLTALRVACAAGADSLGAMATRGTRLLAGCAGTSEAGSAASARSRFAPGSTSGSVDDIRCVRGRRWASRA